MWRLYIVALSMAIVCCSAEIGSYDYDNKIEENTPNDRDNLTSNVYVLPEQIFNDGKPFYVKKDSTGSIDFNAKTTPESLPSPTDAVSTQTTTLNNSNANAMNSTRKHDISLDNTVRTQNIHDYLNLPVKYQSSKFVYPLVSSSYANLKYQGSNKNYVSNHKYDSSTVKSVAYTTKKYKSTYPTKSYATSSASRTSSTTESYDSSTKATPLTTNSTRKYASIPSRTSTPGRRYTTLSRVSSTTVRNSLPNTDVKFTRGRSTTTTTTTTTTTSKPNESFESSFVTPTPIASLSSSTSVAPEYNIKNTTESTKDSDSMGIGDLFWNFFGNNDESDETEATKVTPSTTVMTLRSTVSTTHAPSVTKDYEHTRPYTSRYNITMDSATRKPINRTVNISDLSTSTTRTIESNGDRFASASTAAPLIADYGDKTTLHAGKFRPPTNVNNIRVSPGANTATFITNGQVSAGAGFGGVHPFSEQNTNTYKGQFQPPSQNHMNSIVVLPDTNSASIVATGQLQTTTRFDQKPVPPNDNVHRPNSNQNTIDETTKPGITFISKGQVTSAEAYDNPNVFHGPSAANSNNIVIAPGMQTASFVTSSQMSLGGEKSSPQDQQIKNIENEINVYGSGMQSTQRPHGFLLPSTTSIPKPVNTIIAQSASSENQTQHIRFPNENGENAEKLVGSPSVQPPEATTNNTIKFPTNQVPQAVLQIPQAPPAPVNEGLVKFTDTRNEITDSLIDPNNYKQIIQTPSLPAAGSFVVFRPQPAIAVQHPPSPPQLIMGMGLPQMIRNTPFVFKKPPTFVHYPRKNYTLPNILPQFRPTQPQPLSPEIANKLRQGQINHAQYLYNAQNLRYKVPMQYMPTYSQRPMQIRPSIDQTQPNRRHFELHPGNFNQRIYDRPLLPSHLFNRNTIGVNALLAEPQRFEENMKVTATNGNLDGSSKNVDFENGDGKLISAKQSIVESQKEIPKVEPVTTLQMIQHQRQLQKTGGIVATNGLSGGGNRNATTFTATATATANIDANGKTEKPLYVVYPMQKQSIASLNPMQRGNGEIATILADQMHKPATIQQLGLPYTLEKNKSRYILNSRPAYEFEKKSEQQQDPIAAENDEEDSDRPIAIAYSPTEPNPPHLADVYRPTPAHHHSTPVFVNAANDENLNANQQFQAPFIPSINLENTQSTHNGWLIVTPPTSVVGGGSGNGGSPQLNTESKSNRISASLVNSNATVSISRSDSDETGESIASVENTTRKFDFDHFKPEFQSGFVPIYKGSTNPPPPPAPEQNEPVQTPRADNDKSDHSDISLESLLYDDDDDEN